MSTSTYREYSPVPVSAITKIPDGLNLEPGVAVGAYLQGLTALTLVHESSHGVKKGDWVLVHAAAGGVGLVLVQLLSEIGARVIGELLSSSRT